MWYDVGTLEPRDRLQGRVGKSGGFSGLRAGGADAVLRATVKFSVGVSALDTAVTDVELLVLDAPLAAVPVRRERPTAGGSQFGEVDVDPRRSTPPSGRPRIIVRRSGRSWDSRRSTPAQDAP